MENFYNDAFLKEVEECMASLAAEESFDEAAYLDWFEGSAYSTCFDLFLVPDPEGGFIASEYGKAAYHASKFDKLSGFYEEHGMPF